MLRKAVAIGAIFASATAISPAFAQSLGGQLIIQGPIYQRALPLAPDAVFDMLETAGYREFGPMAPREPIYKVRAVNPEGDLVELDVSMFTGEIELELILAEHQRPPLRAYRHAPQPQVSAAPPRPPAPRTAPPSPQVEDDEHDPLVVY